jgi:hypothetical protein
MTSGIVTLADHAVATRGNGMKGSPPLIPAPPHGLIKPFESVEPEGLRHLNSTLEIQLKLPKLTPYEHSPALILDIL